MLHLFTKFNVRNFRGFCDICLPNSETDAEIYIVVVSKTFGEVNHWRGGVPVSMI